MKIRKSSRSLNRIHFHQESALFFFKRPNVRTGGQASDQMNEWADECFACTFLIFKLLSHTNTKKQPSMQQLPQPNVCVSLFSVLSCELNSIYFAEANTKNQMG